MKRRIQVWIRTVGEQKREEGRERRSDGREDCAGHPRFIGPRELAQDQLRAINNTHVKGFSFFGLFFQNSHAFTVVAVVFFFFFIHNSYFVL